MILFVCFVLDSRNGQYDFTLHSAYSTVRYIHSDNNNSFVSLFLTFRTAASIRLESDGDIMATLYNKVFGCVIVVTSAGIVEVYQAQVIVLYCIGPGATPTYTL